MIPSFWLGISVTTLGLLVLHWFPWRKPLHKLVAYSMGTGSILLGQFLWLGWCEQFLLLAAFPAVGGLATALAYWHDRDANLALRVEHHERND
jgi:uncharacterized membrane protein